MTNSTSTQQKHFALQCQFCSAWNRIDAAKAQNRPTCGNCKRPFLLDRPYPLTDESFERTIRESEIPVLVDFFADWCGPCKIMAPHVDTVAAKYQGQVLVAKLNTDFNQKVAQSFDIRSIPTTIVFRGGESAARQSGALQLAALEKMLVTEQE